MLDKHTHKVWDTDEQDPATHDAHDECENCGNIVTANPFSQRRKWLYMCPVYHEQCK